MKYVLIFGLVLVVVWLWRSSRQVRKRDTSDENKHQTSTKPGAVMKTTEIIACSLCHVHLPRTEALAGKHGLYCSAAHRQQADN
jgi:uncharacterized protein